jgi:translation elongation factor EF-4
VKTLRAGDVAVCCGQIMNVADTGWAIHHARRQTREPAFAGVQDDYVLGILRIYPRTGRNTRFEGRVARLALNDASLLSAECRSRWGSGSGEDSWDAAYGDHPGAAEREFDLDLVTTAPA